MRNYTPWFSLQFFNMVPNPLFDQKFMSSGHYIIFTGYFNFIMFFPGWTLIKFLEFQPIKHTNFLTTKRRMLINWLATRSPTRFFHFLSLMRDLNSINLFYRHCFYCMKLYPWWECSQVQSPLQKSSQSQITKVLSRQYWSQNVTGRRLKETTFLRLFQKFPSWFQNFPN